jgi:hypothetical protein
MGGLAPRAFTRSRKIGSCEIDTRGWLLHRPSPGPHAGAGCLTYCIGSGLLIHGLGSLAARGIAFPSRASTSVSFLYQLSICKGERVSLTRSPLCSIPGLSGVQSGDRVRRPRRVPSSGGRGR